MKLTVVTFRAFDRTHTEFFLDKSFEQIHEALHEKCSTYMVQSILESEDAHFMPVAKLEKFQEVKTVNLKKRVAELETQLEAERLKVKELTETKPTEQ